MNTQPITAETVEFEIVLADIKQVSTELSVPSDKASALFVPFVEPFKVAAALLAKESEALSSAEARALRLQMVKARTSITATKDESKSDIKLSGNIIDWFHNKGRDRLAAAEARLMKIEKEEERAETARVQALKDERAEALATIEHEHFGANLGMMSAEQWGAYHQQAKDAFLARREREAKAKVEAEAAAKKEAEEREAQRMENIRLRDERDKALAEARKKEAAAARAAEIARQQADIELMKEREAARIEREKIEAAAAEDRRKAIEAAAIETRKREAAEAAAKAENAKLEAEAKALRDAEAKRIADEKAEAEAKAEAEKKAAAAPDKAKLMEFAVKVRSLVVPLAKSEAGQAVAAEINKKVEGFAKWIKAQAATL